jgi:hypothetical protein
MAVEPATDDAHAQDIEAHVRDYSGFTKMLKYTAIVCFLIAMVVMMIIS